MRNWAPPALTLRQLQYALAVAETKNFRKAALVCAVAQPSLSAQIMDLEEALGVRLFERLPRGVVVTEAGAALLVHARQMLRDAADLAATAERLRDPLSATLRVGIIPTVAPYLLPEVAKPLRSAYPRLQLLWDEERTDALLQKLADGELDAALLALGSEGFEDLRYEVLGKEPFYLVTALGHPLARRAKRSLRLDALDGETVLLLDDGHCFRDQALSVCRRAGAEEASVRATSISTLAQMVAGGVGITLLPGIALRSENRARSLVALSFGARAPTRTLVLAWRKTNPRDAALRLLAGKVAEQLGVLIAALPSA
ncbi:MAG TPA: LysR substrate-binding domain-containing protein [Polyangiaceae bacterium]|nr:LysR substrate-binding domain-containing protein [Polyangiaceae bacterium]